MQPIFMTFIEIGRKMPSIKIAHEAPLAFMPMVQQVTDYDYALVHLFEDEDKEFASKYYEFFENALAKGREVVLDNSLFELEESFDIHRFFDWVYKLKPTWYIIPDCLEDKDKTLQRVQEWFELVREQESVGKKLVSKSIAVCQGKSSTEIYDCYEFLCPLVDKIAISFDYSFYLHNRGELLTEEETYCIGRQNLIKNLLRRLDNNPGITPKPIHLLGCACPQEFKFYVKRQYSLIQSADTSNPVVHGLNGIRYKDYGLRTKIRTKLIEYRREDPNFVGAETIANIFYNIGKFKSFIQ